jgi:hypothetical protein
MNKYHNETMYYKGRRYDSKKEARYANLLDILKKAQSIHDRVSCWFSRVTFTFACGTRMIVDFAVCFADGHWELHDVKGGNITKTNTYRVKKKMLKHEYGLDIKEV